jgi:hypothetical protein
MNDRNDRARTLQFAKDLADPDWSLSVPKVAKDNIRKLLAIIEASKPRTITTAEELDALPVESVVRSDMGNVYVKDYDLDDPSAIWWVTAGAVSEFPSISISLPATVLYEPEAAK